MNTSGMPFSWLSWEPIDDYLSVLFHGVKWEGDFGVFKKNECCDSLVVDYSEATVLEYNDEGLVKRRVAFKLVPR